MPYWAGWPEKFDFVLWIRLSSIPAPPLAVLQPWASGSFFDIYRVIAIGALAASRRG